MGYHRGEGEGAIEGKVGVSEGKVGCHRGEGEGAIEGKVRVP